MTSNQLQKQCAKMKLPTYGSKDEMLARILSSSRASTIGSGKSNGVNKGVGKQTRKTNKQATKKNKNTCTPRG